MASSSPGWRRQKDHVTHRVLETANRSFFEMRLQRQVFSLEEEDRKGRALWSTKHMVKHITKTTKTLIFKGANHVLWNACQPNKIFWMKTGKPATFLESFSPSWLQTSRRKKIRKTSAVETLGQTCLHLTPRRTQHRRSLNFVQWRVGHFESLKVVLRCLYKVIICLYL